MNAALRPLLGQLHPVAGHSRETDLQGVSFGPHGFYLNGLARRHRRNHHRLGREVEGDAQDVGVLGVEFAAFVEVVGLAAQGPADHLLAKQLGAEGAHAQHVADGVGIPPFGEHRDRHHAADRIPQPARFAHRVHDLPEQVLVADFLGLEAVAGALDDLPPKAVDLIGRHFAKVPIQGLAGLQLFAVDQERARPRVLVAVLVKVAKQFQATVLERRRAVVLLAVKAGDVVVDQLGSGSVVADYDEAGRH